MGVLTLARNLWIGFTRGLLLGLIGGLLAGSVEAASIIRDAPTFRAALYEAALYAAIVDALAAGALAAAVGALFAAVHGLLGSPLAPRTAAAVYFGGSASLVAAFVGWMWAFRANGADWNFGVPTPIVASIVGVAIGVGVSAYALARPAAWSILANSRSVAAAGIVASLALALVIPLQVLLEAAQHTSRTQRAAGALRALEPEILEADLIEDLQVALERLLEGTTIASSVPPNVLLITVDALRADHIGACGNGWIQTPTMDLLARHGVLSCNTYTQQPQTNPAVASIFTGLYPAVHGVRLHMVDRLSDSFDTLAEVMQRNGYNTSAVIPWTSLEPAFSGFHQGFQTYEAFVVNEPPALQNPATAALAGVYRRVTDQLALGSVVESVLGLREGTEAEIDGRADVTTTAAMTWLANHGDSRFFLWVHYFDPHYPFTPPEPWDQLYDQGYNGRYDGSMGFVYEMREGIFEPDARDVEYLRALYASEVSLTDYYLGQLLGYMARVGLLENTIVVLTADHGESLGERGQAWPSGDYWLHGDDLYQTGIQVPLMVYDPRSQRGPQLLGPPIEHVDIMPTILDLVGLPLPRFVQGRSLLPLLSGRDSVADRVAVSTLADDSQTAVISAQGWKLIANLAGGPRELYYLPGDPDERLNVAALYPDRVAALAQRLEMWALANQTGLAQTPDPSTGEG